MRPRPMTQVRPADLAAAGAVVVDGGMGTLLQDKGLDDGGSGELWNVERPDVVRDAHRGLRRAGARILTTNTFGGSRPRLDMHGLGDRVHELNEAAARLAREVADEHGALVAGGLGPTGELMAPLGTHGRRRCPGDVRRAARRPARRRHRPGADRDDERPRRGRGRGGRGPEVVPELPIVATLSFDTNLRSMMGVRPADAVDRAGRGGVDAVGANCGRGRGRWRRSPPSWSRPGPRVCCWSPSPTPGCRRSSVTTSSTTPRPDDMAAHATRAARPRHRPDRCLLRLDAGAHPRIGRALRMTTPMTDGAVVGEDGVARCPWAGPPGTMRDYHDTEWGVPVRGERACSSGCASRASRPDCPGRRS